MLLIIQRLGTFAALIDIVISRSEALAHVTNYYKYPHFIVKIAAGWQLVDGDRDAKPGTGITAALTPFEFNINPHQYAANSFVFSSRSRNSTAVW